jgi:propionyl-CoA carboxylase alpha chain
MASTACSRLLVANRGEIARRIFRTARAMGLRTVAVYSDGDAAAPFVGEADEAVALRGVSAAESYLDAAKILDAAQRTGADAIHPGYGFLAENAAFARAVTDAGLTWVGPPADAISAVGDKLAAKELMAGAGVPVLPSAKVSGGDAGGVAAEIGFPVLVKAAAGGGGKGMRVVTSPDQLEEAVASARREAAASFGDDTVFLETYLPAPRHVEIQVLGDRHGQLVHLFERECSIQRRHQKLIEEAPSPVLTPALRAAMGEAAVAAARAIGYCSAGTVEFLLDGESFFFLEVNTRLQVEHPVTEAVTGLDLVREQIRIAAGEPLGYGQDDLAIDGHAIEARLYAEDPASDFLPATGVVEVWEPAGEPAARFDSGIERGSVVGVDFDPMLAKVIVHAPTRTEAALRLALVLERTRLAGLTTNRDFLAATLRSPEFLAGDTTTDFIERVDVARVRLPSDDELRTAALAVAMRSQAANREAAGAFAFVASGWRNSPMPPEELVLERDGVELRVRYQRRRDSAFDASVGEVTAEVRVLAIDGDDVDLEIDGRRTTLTAERRGHRWHVHGPGGDVTFVARSRFPERGRDSVAGGQTAPMPGKVVAVRVAAGDEVEPGQVLVVLEAMKMEHQVTAPERGVVSEVLVAVGQQVENGVLLVVVDAA